MTNAVVDDPADPSKAETVCMSCSSHLAQRWNTPDGPAVLCRECAILHDLGCP